MSGVNRLRQIREKEWAGQSGQALVELALVVPLLFVVIVNVVNFGGFFLAAVSVASAARDGANYMARGANSLGGPSTPTAAQIATNVANVYSNSLPNKSSLGVRMCTRTPSGGASTTLTCSLGTSSFSTASGTCTSGNATTCLSNPAADSSTEASAYTMGWVDVVYTYQTFVPVYVLTLPSSVVVHRQAVGRILQ
jgi:Flp pilus assembly protein TadG